MILREDRSLLAVAHLSQLLDVFTGVGGWVVPLILWVTQRDKILNMDRDGKTILNFRITMLIYFLVCIPLVLLLGLGLLGMLVIAVIAFIFPIVNAIKASNGEEPYYPFNIAFIK